MEQELQRLDPKPESPVFKPLPMAPPAASASEEVCCGPPPSPPSSPMERPGYKLEPFVESFMDTAAGRTPRVKTAWVRSDWIGTMLARATSLRNDYKVTPGLYAVGAPGKDSPVLVTANYKLTFDTLRKHLTGLDVWLVVLDTRGVNVWCAAGKGFFGTTELIARVKSVRLDEVVDHRKLILPQLGATGVSGREVKKGCGFEVVWGPVRADDLPRFLENGAKADEGMREVTFTLVERLVLTPIELNGVKKPALWILLAIFMLSGIGSDIFSFGQAWDRGLMGALALIVGILAGAVAAPLLLPYLPTPAFSVKGAVTGLIGSLAVLIAVGGGVGLLGTTALVLFTTAVSSFLAMNFTGSTPYTSPTGVEKEMRKYIPFQALAAGLAVIAWIGAGFAA
jgi:hypothetical protein